MNEVLTLISVSHFVQDLLSSLTGLVVEVNKYGYHRNPVLKILLWTIIVVQHGIRLGQFGLLGLLFYIVVEVFFSLHIGKLTMDIKDPCLGDFYRTNRVPTASRQGGLVPSYPVDPPPLPDVLPPLPDFLPPSFHEMCVYCEPNLLKLGMFTVCFQIANGIAVFIVWLVTWYYDEIKSEAEQRELDEMMKEKSMSTLSTKGVIKNSLLIAGMETFFGTRVSGALLSTSMTLPISSCTTFLGWYLMAGVIHLLNGVLDDCTKEVFKKTKKDKLINIAEYHILFSMKFFRFPIVAGEILVYFAICYEFLKLSKDSAYCETAIFNFALVIFVIYSVVLTLRLLIFIGTFLPKSSTDSGTPDVLEDESGHKLKGNYILDGKEMPDYILHFNPPDDPDYFVDCSHRESDEDADKDK